MVDIVLRTTGYEAHITGVSEDEGFSLHWHDYIVNEWSEWYATLPQALIRLATLEHSSTTGEGFIHGEDNFQILADAFLKGAVNA